MRYLDPKADLTFKRVFGEHKDLLQSFLNALLPFEDGEEIVSLEYLPPELVPENPLKRNSIVDVRCKDNHGRQFIVEMQVAWTPGFEQRVLFNASKAYVRQLDRNERYELLEPVYALSLLDYDFLPDLPHEFYHLYRMVHVGHTDKYINGLQLVFIDLTKFSPHSIRDKKMAVLWLRFLTEIDEKTRNVPRELLENPEVHKALRVVEESAYTETQLYGYEQFWDTVRVEKSMIYGSLEYGRKEGKAEGMAEGMAKGLAEGMEKGMAKGMEKGKMDGIMEVARNLKKSGMPVEQIKQVTHLSDEELSRL